MFIICKLCTKTNYRLILLTYVNFNTLSICVKDLSTTFTHTDVSLFSPSLSLFVFSLSTSGHHL